MLSKYVSSLFLTQSIQQNNYRWARSKLFVYIQHLKRSTLKYNCMKELVLIPYCICFQQDSSRHYNYMRVTELTF